MKLYHHYKNKPYIYVGLARHSETLEEMVIYETRYENASGRVWVRPKDMFFEKVELNGKPTARFKEIQLKIVSKSDVTDADIDMIASLVEGILGEWDSQRFHSTYCQQNKFRLWMAYVEDQPAGFKIGFELNQNEFYSWLGGVLPEFRGLGIAGDLMVAQHEWCRKQGYLKIGTKTKNQFKSMLILNIKNGFEIIGTEATDKGDLKILMEKKL